MKVISKVKRQLFFLKIHKECLKKKITFLFSFVSYFSPSSPHLFNIWIMNVKSCLSRNFVHASRAVGSWTKKYLQLLNEWSCWISHMHPCNWLLGVSVHKDQRKQNKDDHRSLCCNELCVGKSFLKQNPAGFSEIPKVICNSRTCRLNVMWRPPSNCLAICNSFNHLITSHEWILSVTLYE